MKVDPITLEVIRHGLSSAACQVDANITRTAFSPYIYEYKDYAVGLVDAAARIRPSFVWPSFSLSVWLLRSCPKPTTLSPAMAGDLLMPVGPVKLRSRRVQAGGEPSSVV